jgi:hypothetical protein
VDEQGFLVFPARVKRVEADGRLVLEYDGGIGEGLELPEKVRGRVQMPWHPKFLKGQLVIMLRRNMGHGRVLEGLEVRWSYVARIMKALTHIGRYRMDGSDGPMHKHYDPRLFDVLDEAEVRERYAPKVWQGEFVDEQRAAEIREQGGTVEHVDVYSPEEMLAAGLDVRFLGSVGTEGDDAEGAGSGVEALERDVFCKWLELREMRLGNIVAKWWVALAPGEDGDALSLKHGHEECVADLFITISEDVKEAAAAEVPCDFSVDFVAQAKSDGGVLSVRSLALWCRDRIARDFGRRR